LQTFVIFSRTIRKRSRKCESVEEVLSKIV
jgi:hypothetical protein